jgi:hypothetical protein
LGVRYLRKDFARRLYVYALCADRCGRVPCTRSVVVGLPGVTEREERGLLGKVLRFRCQRIRHVAVDQTAAAGRRSALVLAPVLTTRHFGRARHPCVSSRQAGRQAGHGRRDIPRAALPSQ